MDRPQERGQVTWNLWHARTWDAERIPGEQLRSGYAHIGKIEDGRLAGLFGYALGLLPDMSD